MAQQTGKLMGFARLSVTVSAGGDGHVKTVHAPGRCKVPMVIRRQQMQGKKMLNE